MKLMKLKYTDANRPKWDVWLLDTGQVASFEANSTPVNVSSRAELLGRIESSSSHGAISGLIEIRHNLGLKFPRLHHAYGSIEFEPSGTKENSESISTGRPGRKAALPSIAVIVGLLYKGLRMEDIGEVYGVSGQAVSMKLTKNGIHYRHSRLIGCVKCETDPYHPVSRNYCKRCHHLFVARCKRIGLKQKRPLSPIGCSDCQTNHYAKGMCRNCYEKNRNRQWMLLEQDVSEIRNRKGDLIACLRYGILEPQQIDKKER